MEDQNETIEEETQEKPQILKDVEKVKDEVSQVLEESRKVVQELRELRATELLSGTADAGQAPPEKKSKDEEVKDRVNKMLEGTGLSI